MFEDKRFDSVRHPGEYLDYLCHRPAGGGKRPLLLYLHGAGSRGQSLSQINHVGPIGELEKGRDIPAVILAPQCHEETWFDLFHVLCEFIQSAVAWEDVDPDRVYVTGNSMGGYATWQLCISHPDWFAAAVPVCGGGMHWEASRMTDLPLWAFHGDKDDTVPVEESIKMVGCIKWHGGTKARLTVLPGTGHNAWDPAYANDEMWAWLFAQRKGA